MQQPSSQQEIVSLIKGGNYRAFHKELKEQIINEPDISSGLMAIDTGALVHDTLSYEHLLRALINNSSSISDTDTGTVCALLDTLPFTETVREQLAKIDTMQRLPDSMEVALAVQMQRFDIKDRMHEDDRNISISQSQLLYDQISAVDETAEGLWQSLDVATLANMPTTIIYQLIYLAVRQRSQSHLREIISAAPNRLLPSHMWSLVQHAIDTRQCAFLEDYFLDIAQPTAQNKELHTYLGVNRLLQSGKLVEAQKIYDDTAKFTPHSPYMLLARAVIQQHKKDKVWYESDLRNVLCLHPQQLETSEQLIWFLLSQARDEEASDIIRQCSDYSAMAYVLAAALGIEQADKAILRQLTDDPCSPVRARMLAARYLLRIGFEDRAALLSSYKTIARQKQVYAPNRIVQHCEYITKHLDAPLAVEADEYKSHIRRAFVMSLPQAGSDYLEQLLLQDERIKSDGASNLANECVHRIPKALKSPHSYPQCLAELDATTARMIRHSWFYTSFRYRTTELPEAMLDVSWDNFLHGFLLDTLFPDALFVYITIDDAVLARRHRYADYHRYAQWMDYATDENALTSMINLNKQAFKRLKQHVGARAVEIDGRLLLEDPGSALEPFYAALDCPAPEQDFDLGRVMGMLQRYNLCEDVKVA